MTTLLIAIGVYLGVAVIGGMAWATVYGPRYGLDRLSEISGRILLTLVGLFIAGLVFFVVYAAVAGIRGEEWAQ